MSRVTDFSARAVLATLPTPLEVGPTLPGGARLWMKRDDLSGLGGGGNKARKLEFLCGAALADGADALVTVGAAQSNHCRMTAAAGAKLGLEVHLVLSGDEPARGEATGNQLLSALFGAQLHYTGAPDHHWGELEIARESVTDALAADGLRPYSIPIGGSTADRRARVRVGVRSSCSISSTPPASRPSTIVFTSSSGGTHAGLLAGRAAALAAGRTCPDILAVGVAKGVNIGYPDVAALADETLALMGLDVTVDESDVEVDTRWIGDDYAVPTAAGDAAIRWAAAPRRLVAGPHLLRQGFRRPARGGRRGPVRRGDPTSCSSTPAGGRRCSPAVAHR